MVVVVVRWCGGVGVVLWWCWEVVWSWWWCGGGVVVRREEIGEVGCVVSRGVCPRHTSHTTHAQDIACCCRFDVVSQVVWVSSRRHVVVVGRCCLVALLWSLCCNLLLVGLVTSSCCDFVLSSFCSCRAVTMVVVQRRCTSKHIAYHPRHRTLNHGNMQVESAVLHTR